MNQRSPSEIQARARAENQSFDSANGRVTDEARLTLAALRQDEVPKTVLGGLLLYRRLNPGDTNEARTVYEISEKVSIDPTSPNHRGDTPVEVLKDLVEVGWCAVAPDRAQVNGLLLERYILLEVAEEGLEQLANQL